jgi:hypothetical protein
VNDSAPPKHEYAFIEQAKSSVFHQPPDDVLQPEGDLHQKSEKSIALIRTH